MTDAELIIKAYFHNEPDAKKLRTKIFLIEFVLKLTGYEVIGDLGLSGIVVYYSKKSKKTFHLYKW